MYRKVKDLHMATSIGGLNKLANDKATMILKASPPSMMLNSMEKVYNQAKLDYDLGDEEKAYVLYMRVGSLWSTVIKSNTNNRPVLEDPKHGRMFKESVVKCEELVKNLEARYTEAAAAKSGSVSSSSSTPSSALPMPGKIIKANNNNSTSNNTKTTINSNGYSDDLSFVKNGRLPDSNVNSTMDGDSVIPPSIEPEELYNLFVGLYKSRSKETILLLDARRKEDFDDSHMFNLRYNNVKVLNIPEHLLVKGTAATKLMKSLAPDAQSVLRERKTASKVIIFDWKSNNYSENEHLEALYEALWKFDNKECCTSSPILLRKGYYGWVNSYPTFTSNPNPTPPVTEEPPDTDYDSLCLNFYSSLQKPVDSPNQISSQPSINGLDRSPDSPIAQINTNSKDGNTVVPGLIQDSNELVVRLTNSKLKDNSNKIPGSAQPVPTVNRQVKPKLATTTAFNREGEVNGFSTILGSKTITPSPPRTNGPSTTNESNDRMKMNLQDRRHWASAQEELSRLSEIEKVAREKEEELKKVEAEKEQLLRENVNLKRKMKPTGLPDSSMLPVQPLKPIKFNLMCDEMEEGNEPNSEDENGMGNDQDEDMPSPSHNPIIKPILSSSASLVKRSEERTVSESSSPTNVTPRPPMIAKIGKSLSRSYSSPNIADHLEDEESQNRTPATHAPTYDRALKPLNNVSDFPRNFATASARMRNFSPIYGIPGQVNTGLKNLGNTCFMNAVLQCLADTCIFRRYFLQEKHMADISRNSRLGSKGELADELGALIREIRSYQYKSVSPANFKEAVGTHMPFFMGCEQQDAHEFLCMLFEKLHADLNKAPAANQANGVFTLPDDLPAHIAITKFWNHHISRNRSIVSELFEGLLMSTLKCTACGKQSHSFEVFTNLSLPIPTKLGHRFTILDCLDLFSDEEKLYGEAAWECPTCKVKRDAIKQIKICKLPKVLVIHLKRFSYEGKWRQKLQNMVDFPLFDLKLKKYRSCSSTDSFDVSYDLYGVVNHYGTLEGGHYVAYCKNDEKNKWFKYDDHEVTELSAADVKSHAAYLLFYTSKNQ